MKKKPKIWLTIIAALVIMLLVIWISIGKAVAPTSFWPLSKKVVNKSTTTSFNKKLYSLTDPTSPWVITNKVNPLQPKTYTPSDLVAVGNGQYMRSQAAKKLLSMFAAANAAGASMQPLSGYRSYQTQLSVYGREVRSYGQVIADSESARPGYSEHQTGWAIDVGGGNCGIEDCFGKTKAGQWVVNNAYKYGFIVRYPSGKSTVTGYRAEPWHIRYVGVGLATEMHNKKIATLEEFFSLPPATSY